ncbi:MAG TPA: magnesium transporter, partial [Chitinophagaceae bacterium]|nr:magnesium transporter [Chitinophagaceae bacterium]
MEMDQMPIQQQFEEVIVSDNLLEVKEFLNNQNISDVANLIYENPDYEIQIISTLSIHRSASVFKILDLMEQKRIIKKLPAIKSAELLNELSADDRVDFFEELPTGTVRELLKMLNPEERKITLKLLGYPENSVGRLMIPNYIYVYEHNSMQEVFETIRRYGKNTETIDVIYIINDNGELLDDIRIRDFLLAPPQTKVSDLMDNRYIHI